MIYTLALWGLFFGFAAQDSPIKILDLREAEMIYPDRVFGPSLFQVGIPSGLGIPIHALPALSLDVKFDKASYVIGEEFTYELRLKNISEIDIRIPLESNGPKIVPGGDVMTSKEIGLIEISAILNIDENIEINKEHPNITSEYSFLSLFGLYGSDKIESSFMTLNQGESILIKYKGRWREMDDESTTSGKIYMKEEKEGKIVIHVNAEWRFRSGLYRTLKDVPYNYITKSESIPIEIIIPPKKDKNVE